MSVMQCQFAQRLSRGSYTPLVSLNITLWLHVFTPYYRFQQDAFELHPYFSL